MARILIVDDEPDLVSFLMEELGKRGYEASAAFSGEEALKKLEGNHMDLVLLDIRMPGMDGLETLRRLQQISGDAAVIVVSAVHDEQIAKEALNLGAHDYVMKPIDFAHLEMVMNVTLIEVDK